ncbi:MAG TPA: PAS domain S-box protein [Syntrophales bacterium]|nr:PAS domain S-box protein [Syntrophales bacterium]
MSRESQLSLFPVTSPQENSLPSPLLFTETIPGKKRPDSGPYLKTHRALADRSSEGILILQDGIFTFVNRRVSDHLGVPIEGLEGPPFFDHVWHEDRDRVLAYYQKRVKGENVPDSYEFRVVNRDGGLTWVRLSAVGIPWNGRPAILYLLTDITKRKDAEEELRLSEIKFRALAESTSALIFLIQDTKIQYVNPAFEAVTGYSMEDVAGMNFWDIVHPDHREMVKARGLKRLEGEEQPPRYEIRIVAKDGTEKWLDLSSTVSRIHNKNTTVASAFDITERKRAEQSLRESRQQLMDIINFFPDATVVVDREEKIIAWNRAAELLTGVKKEDMLGKGNREYSIPFYGDRRPALIDLALHPDPAAEARFTSIRRTGDIIFGEAYTPNIPPGDVHMSAKASVLRDSRGEIVAAIECLRNNTERRQMEERLARAEKMEALGTLAGGVAHDLNNVLGVLVGYSELLAEKLPEGTSTRKYAENILTSSIKGAAIIQDLLTLARRGVPISEVIGLNRVVTDYLQAPEFEKLLSFHRGVVVRPELAEDLLNIKGSPIHLSKTVMNLVSNAAEAISGQGVVTVRTENRHLDRPLSGYDDMQPGDYVVLTVSDTGNGIPARDIDKIFEPFYSKKVMGRSGTGLGLAIVWGTVKDHGGYIDVKSGEGTGTTFALYFPVTREEPARVEGARPAESLAGRGETVLVVDDVREQRELAISMLTRLGYRAEAVASGEEAVDHVNRKTADLVVLDMIMDPGIDGLETYRRIRKINPRQRAIIVSGFSQTERVREAQELGAGTFVRKPYVLEKIGLAVRRELDRAME